MLLFYQQGIVPVKGSPAKDAPPAGHGHLCSLTFQEKLTICLQLITHIRERVIEWAMAKWPGLGKSTVQKVLTAGASHWQDYVNGGHGNEYRLKSPTCYGEAMKSVDTKLRELHEKNFGITKVDVLEKLQAACTGLTAQALQDRNEFFMRYYGWNWRRYARCTRLAPLDLDAKITNWAQTFFAMNRARNYEYAVCLDETSLLEEGSAHGWVICPRGSKAQPKIASNDEKKTVTVLFGTVTHLPTGKVKPLRPLVIFGRATSDIYAEVTKASADLGYMILADISDTHWVKQDIYPRYINTFLPIGGINGPRLPTVLIDDTYKGHHIALVDLPPNVDRHQIPGGATKDLQVGDLFENARFQHDFDRSWMSEKIRTEDHDPLQRPALMALILKVNQQVWKRYLPALESVHKKIRYRPSNGARMAETRPPGKTPTRLQEDDQHQKEGSCSSARHGSLRWSGVRAHGVRADSWHPS